MHPQKTHRNIAGIPILNISMALMLIGLMLFTQRSLADVDLVFVDKSERKMYLFDGQKQIREYDVAFGKNPIGHKQQEGDERTPEGQYVLDYKNENSSFYRSMHISYPNKLDKERAQQKGVLPGGLIMIHGQKNWLGWLAPIMQQFNWTDGCIALTNAEMDDFMQLVNVGTTITIEW